MNCASQDAPLQQPNRRPAESCTGGGGNIASSGAGMQVEGLIKEGKNPEASGKAHNIRQDPPEPEFNSNLRAFNWHRRHDTPP
jgi:hypothetical protein